MAEKYPDDDFASMLEKACLVDESILMIVGDMLGKDWKAFGLQLGLTATAIECIELDERTYGVKIMAFKSLDAWKKREGDNATMEKLINNLIAIERRDIVDKISPRPNSLPSKNAENNTKLTGTWTTSYDLSLFKLRSEIRDYKQQGYRLTNLVGYEDNGNERYLTLWIKDTTVEWEAMQAMSKDEYVTAVKDFTLKGYKVTKVCGYCVSNTTMFAAIWEKRENSVVVTKVNMTNDMFIDDVWNYNILNCRLAHVNSYAVNNEEYLAAIWQNPSVSSSRAIHNYSLADFKKKCEYSFDDGYRLKTVFGQCLHYKDYYGGLFQKGSGVVNVKYDLSYNEYLHQLDFIRAQKFIPISVHAFTSGSVVKYCIMWE